MPLSSKRYFSGRNSGSEQFAAEKRGREDGKHDRDGDRPGSEGLISHPVGRADWERILRETQYAMPATTTIPQQIAAHSPTA